MTPAGALAPNAPGGPRPASRTASRPASRTAPGPRRAPATQGIQGDTRAATGAADGGGMQFLAVLAVVVTLFLLVSAYPTAAVIIGVLLVLVVVAVRVRRPARRRPVPVRPEQPYQRVKGFRTSEFRATDDDRELTAGVLAVALRNGSLTVSEYSERCGIAGAAQSRQQLFGCVRDLDF